MMFSSVMFGGAKAAGKGAPAAADAGGMDLSSLFSGLMSAGQEEARPVVEHAVERVAAAFPAAVSEAERVAAEVRAADSRLAARLAAKLAARHGAGRSGAGAGAFARLEVLNRATGAVLFAGGAGELEVVDTPEGPVARLWADAPPSPPPGGPAPPSGAGRAAAPHRRARPAGGVN